MTPDPPDHLLQRKRRWLIALIASGLFLALSIIVGLGATVWRMQQTMSLVDSATVSDSAFEDMITRAILWGKLGLAAGTLAFAAYLLSFVMHQRAKQQVKYWTDKQRSSHLKEL